VAQYWLQIVAHFALQFNNHLIQLKRGDRKMNIGKHDALPLKTEQKRHLYLPTRRLASTKLQEFDFWCRCEHSALVI
jgi:hypothetical protein